MLGFAQHLRADCHELLAACVSRRAYLGRCQHGGTQPQLQSNLVCGINLLSGEGISARRSLPHALIGPIEQGRWAANHGNSVAVEMHLCNGLCRRANMCPSTFSRKLYNEFDRPSPCYRCPSKVRRIDGKLYALRSIELGRQLNGPGNWIGSRENCSALARNFLPPGFNRG